MLFPFQAKMQDFSLSQAFIEGKHLVKIDNVNSMTPKYHFKKLLLSHVWRQRFKILLLARATEELEAEQAAREEAKVHYLGEKLPRLELSGLKVDDLQVRRDDGYVRGSAVASGGTK